MRPLGRWRTEPAATDAIAPDRGHQPKGAQGNPIPLLEYSTSMLKR